MSNQKYLICINGRYYYRRRVPLEYQHLDNRGMVKIALKTSDRSEAVIKVRNLMKEDDILWTSLAYGGGRNSREIYDKAVKNVRQFGFDYKTAQDLANEATIAELRARLDEAERLNAKSNDVCAGAVLGAYDKPEIRLSDMMQTYTDLIEDQLLNKSPNQLRKWKNPKLKAIKNFRATLVPKNKRVDLDNLPDKSLYEITIEDVLNFRRWWLDKIKSENLSGNSANKDIGNMSVMFNVINEFYNLNLDPLFSAKRLKESKARKTPSFQPNYMRDVILNAGAFDGLHAQAAAIIYIVIWTGARPSEICNLQRPDFVLDHKIPHIKIRPTSAELKNGHSERDIPLLFDALKYAEKFRCGFDKFYDRADDFSTLANAFMRRESLFPTKNHTLYSFRHTFATIMTNCGIVDRVQCELMGHSFKSKNETGVEVDRIDYGEGAWLETKLEALIKMSKYYRLDQD